MNATSGSITLTKSMSDYSHLIFAMSTSNSTPDNKISGSLNHPVIGVESYETFKTSAMSGYFCTGSASEGWIQRTCSFTYVDDTHITCAKSVTGNRSFYVYGI